MKHIVNGFRQDKLIKFSLDFVDAAILRYFIDFKKSGKMVCKVLNGDYYYWVSYEGVLKELPMLNMKKYTVQSRFFKLRDLGILTHIVVRQGGTYSYFGIGENYKELITRDKDKNDEGSSSSVNEEACNLEEKFCSVNEEACNSEENFCSVDENAHKENKNARGHGFKSDTNNPSTKDPYIKNIKNTVSFQKTAFEIIEYLNLKTEKNFKSTTKSTTRLIKARLNEKFTVEDFKTVIDNMKSRWTGTKFQQYLAPTTLFGNKFETYLNQGREEHVDGGFKRGNVVSSDEKPKAELEERLRNMVLEEDM
ncbi:conserved phage C-terminal domain-containing protein [Clostridium sp. UBA1056]|uniref:conserved phage C-terminal domain-containing protein n=1 Tax=unclassified Clostridium TaxID=2614128 RepID=UPI00321741C8